MTSPTRPSSLQTDKPILDETAAKQFVSELIATRPRDRDFDACEVLEQNPELNEYNSVILNLAYEEFCRRAESGERLNRKKFVASFPGHESELLEMLRVHQYLDDNDLLQRESVEKWPDVGESFLGFELIEELGRGSFSRVFLATEPGLGDRFVVAKVCSLGKNEAAILGKLQHPQVVRVYTVGHDELSGLSVIPMAYLSRSTLLDVILHGFKNSKTPKKGREILDIIEQSNGMDARLEPVGADKSSLRLLRKCSFVDAVISIAAQLAEALAYTHSHGYVHCDVKPSNVLLTPDGRAMLFDFNLASDKQVDLENIGGTIPYMAPEQLRAVAKPEDHSSHQIDARADVFSFGITIYHLMTGKLPFGPIPQDVSKKQIADELLKRQENGPKSLRKTNPDVVPSFARIVEQCLRFDPVDRPANGSELVELIRRQHSRLKRIQSWVYSRRRFFRATFGASALVSGAYLLHRLTYDSVLRGHEAYADGRFKDAESYYSDAIAANSEIAIRWFWRGRSRLKLGDFSAAESDFVKANDLLPKPDGRVTACAAYSTAKAAKRQIRNRQANLERDAIRSNYGLARWSFNESKTQGFDGVLADHNIAACWYIEDHLISALDILKRVDREHHDVPQRTYLFLAMVDLMNKSDGPPKPEYVEKALASGPPSNLVLFYAASIFAKVQDDTGKFNAIEKVISICEIGLNHGFSNAQFDVIARSLPGLEEDPRFIRLRDQAKKDALPPTPEWLVDPLVGIDEPLLNLGQ